MEQAVGILCFLVLGAAFIVGAAFSWLHTRRFIEESAPTFGEVVGLRQYDGETVTYSPVVRFTGPGGRVVEFTESTSSNPAGYSVGDRVKILYRRSDPSDARVASKSSLYLLAMIFGAIGATMFVVGILLAVFAVIG